MQERISTEEAAAIIGVNRSRVQQLCRAYIATGGGLKCEKIGSGRHAVYLIARKEAERYRDQARKPGWPKGKKRAGGYDTSPSSAGPVTSKKASATQSA